MYLWGLAVFRGWRDHRITPASNIDRDLGQWPELLGGILRTIRSLSWPMIRAEDKKELRVPKMAGIIRRQRIGVAMKGYVGAQGQST